MAKTWLKAPELLNPLTNTMKMHALTRYLLARLGESSTWRGLFMILTGLGIALQPEQIAAITTAGLSLVGLINVLRQEQAVKLLALLLAVLPLASCSTTASGEKTFLGITGAGWLEGGKAALVSAGPILLEERQRVAAKNPRKVQPR